jgi:cysteine desulfurase
MLYLDYNATTPVDPLVADAMQPFLRDYFGNPSSNHALGRASRGAIDKARRQVAAMLDASDHEIIFTSSGTEANNHAIIGAALSRKKQGSHIITSSVEHPAVTEVCKHLETLGFSFTEVPVNSQGQVQVEAVADAITPETVLITIMLANNEVGSLQPVADIARLAKEHGILTHTDCAQAVGKISVSMVDLGVDMLSLAGHKLYGPKGIGVLCLRAGIEIPNLMHGAGHEGGRRPGTENILEIVGLGEACRLVSEDVLEEGPRLAQLRDQLEQAILAVYPSAQVNGHPQLRLPNTLSISFPDLRADAIMAAMPDVAVSAGAACHGGGPVASRVLTNMGVPEHLALGTLRISLGRMTTAEDVELGAKKIGKAALVVRDRKPI